MSKAPHFWVAGPLWRAFGPHGTARASNCWSSGAVACSAEPIVIPYSDKAPNRHRPGQPLCPSWRPRLLFPTGPVGILAGLDPRMLMAMYTTKTP